MRWQIHGLSPAVSLNPFSLVSPLQLYYPLLLLLSTSTIYWMIVHKLSIHLIHSLIGWVRERVLREPGGEEIDEGREKGGKESSSLPYTHDAQAQKSIS